MSSSGMSGWRFVRFGLLVTGRGEHKFLPKLFRSLTACGSCTFEVIRRVEQLRPIDSEKRKLKMVGSGQKLTTRAEETALEARRYLEKHPDSFVLLIDDLERSGVARVQDIFKLYRDALDTMLRPRSLEHRASVQLLVNMVEAYYFADAQAINAVLGTTLPDFNGDVETIRHPKGDLKALYEGFDEVEHGEKIIAKLGLDHVLGRVDCCCYLRSMFAWCARAIGLSPGPQYRLEDGGYSIVTGPQIAKL